MNGLFGSAKIQDIPRTKFVKFANPNWFYNVHRCLDKQFAQHWIGHDGTMPHLLTGKRCAHLIFIAKNKKFAKLILLDIITSHTFPGGAQST